MVDSKVVRRDLSSLYCPVLSFTKKDLSLLVVDRTLLELGLLASLFVGTHYRLRSLKIIAVVITN